MKKEVNMAYHTHTQTPIGCFVHSNGNHFEYSVNPDTYEFAKEFPHIVWVGSYGIGGDQGYRYAIVKKTVAYIAVDEDEFGNSVMEKWYLKRNDKYLQNN